MNKKDIIKELNNYSLDPNEYVIISGAAMVLLGIKDTTGDIDIAVTRKYYDYLLNNYACIFDRTNEYGEKIYFINKINFGTTYYDDNKTYIENLPVQRVEKIRELKLNLNRDKDKKDIELINRFIGDINE